MSNDYLLKVGNAGQARLNALNKLYNSKSQLFLKPHVLKPNLKILEVGGGTGLMSLWLSLIVGEGGEVTVIDSSQEQVDIIKRQAERSPYKNIKVLRMSVDQINKETGGFDLIFSRFLLIHLSNPLEALYGMVDLLNRGGALICEDCIFSNSFCHPVLPAFNKRMTLIKELFDHSDKDADLGKYLYNMFQKLNLKDIQVELSQPVLNTQEEKSIIPQFIRESKDRMIQLRLAASEELDLLVEELVNKIVLQSDHIVASAQVCQISGVKY